MTGEEVVELPIGMPYASFTNVVLPDCVVEPVGIP